MSATPIGMALHGTGWPTPMQITAMVICLCGTPLRAHAGHWDCQHCGRAFCRECGGPMTRNGGCDVCSVCGSGACG